MKLKLQTNKQCLKPIPSQHNLIELSKNQYIIDISIIPCPKPLHFFINALHINRGQDI